MAWGKKGRDKYTKCQKVIMPHYTIRMAINKNKETKTKYWQQNGEIGTLVQCWLGM